MSKLFYEYYRKNGKLKGVVVALDKGTFGWSLCNTKDVFDKSKAVGIAYNRALKSSLLDSREKAIYYSKVPNSLQPLFQKIQERANKYYKQ